jgi:hypothetical protein
MANPGFVDDMGRWTDVVIGHLQNIDPAFACEATHELHNIDHQFPNALTPGRNTGSHFPVVPLFNTPVLRPSPGPIPLSSTPVRVPDIVWTPLHSGGTRPNPGIQGDPSKFTIFISIFFKNL